MKTFAMLFISFPLFSFSQDTLKTTPKQDETHVARNVISTDLFGFATVLFSSSVFRADISYEYAFNKSFSGTFMIEGGNYNDYEISGGNGVENMSFKGYGITPEIRYYPFTGGKRIAPQGLSFAVYYKYFWLTQHYSGKAYSGQYVVPFEQPGNVMGPGIAAAYKLGRNKLHTEFVYGYTFLNSKGFIFDERSGGFNGDTYDSFGLRFEVRLGYQF